jgi:hypothetical protein
MMFRFCNTLIIEENNRYLDPSSSTQALAEKILKQNASLSVALFPETIIQKDGLGEGGRFLVKRAS